MRLAIAITLCLPLTAPAVGQDDRVPIPVPQPRPFAAPMPPIIGPVLPPSVRAVRDAERRLLERAAREPMFAQVPPDSAPEEPPLGMTSVTVYRGPQEAITYRVPRASGR